MMMRANDVVEVVPTRPDGKASRPIRYVYLPATPRVSGPNTEGLAALFRLDVLGRLHPRLHGSCVAPLVGHPDTVWFDGREAVLSRVEGGQPWSPGPFGTVDPDGVELWKPSRSDSTPTAEALAKYDPKPSWRFSHIMTGRETADPTDPTILAMQHPHELPGLTILMGRRFGKAVKLWVDFETPGFGDEGRAMYGLFCFRRMGDRRRVYRGYGSTMGLFSPIPNASGNPLIACDTHVWSRERHVARNGDQGVGRKHIRPGEEYYFMRELSSAMPDKPKDR